MSANFLDDDSIKLTKQLFNNGQIGHANINNSNASNLVNKTRLGIIQSENIKEKQVN
jgi:hypothetical protein